MDWPPAPRHVFVSYCPDGPHVGPVTIGLFGVQDGALLPLFPSREKAVNFAVRVLGSPPRPEERWDGVELPATDLRQFLLADPAIKFVALDPPPSGDVELVPTPDFVEALEREIGELPQPYQDFRRAFVRTLVYGDVS